MRKEPEQNHRPEPEEKTLIDSIIRLLYQADYRKLNNIYHLVIQII